MWCCRYGGDGGVFGILVGGSGGVVCLVLLVVVFVFFP